MNRILCFLFVLFVCFLASAKVPDTLSVRTLEFIQNDGQWETPVLYSARLQGGAVFAESDKFTIALISPQQLHQFYEHKFSGKAQHPLDAAAYKMVFQGCSPNASIIPSEPYPHYYNFFLTKFSSGWRSLVPAYHALRYVQLYSGIDLQVSQSANSLKYEFYILPNSDPSQISISYDGVQSLKLSEGHLLVQTPVARVMELPPVAYQLTESGDTLFIPCRYALEHNTLSFQLGSYDKSKMLVIDPVVVFSSYSGSASDNWGYTATYDSDGNLYGGGICFGVDYPTTTGAYQIDYAGGRTDISISKFNAAGNQLIYSTYLGGSGLDIPHSLYVNDNDELYVFGTSGSSDFPVTANAFDTTFNGGPHCTLSTSLSFNRGSDIIVSKFSASGSSLLASTYVGGTGNDGVNISDSLCKNYADDNRGEILIDVNSDVYVVTSTFSSDFPVTSGSFDTVANGQQDVCVFKMNQDLSQIIWSTYLGGSAADAGYSMALASDNSVFVCGGTRSADFPVTSNAYQQNHTGAVSGFVAHLSDNGRMLEQSTYLGFSDYDQSYLVKVDRQDHPHLFGQTNATDSSWIYNAQYSVAGGGQFLTKLSVTLDTVIWSTAFGSGNGGPDISPTALMVDYCSNIYMSGWGGSPLNGFGGTEGLPVTSDAFQSFTDGSDFYFICISDDASQLRYASFFGGTNDASAREHVDGGTSRFDRKGRIYQAVCAGCGGQSDFPTTPGAWSTTNGSSNCNLGVIKMDFGLPEVVADFSMPRTVCNPDTVHFNDHSQTIGSSTLYFWDFGDGTTSTLSTPTHYYPQSGVYLVTLIVQDLGSCNFADTLTKPILILTNSYDTLPTLTVCEGDYVQIGLQPFANTLYHWLPNEDITNPAISNPVVEPPQSSTYELEITYGGCVDTMRQEVMVHPYPATLMSDTTICKGTEALLHVTLLPTAQNVRIFWSANPDFNAPFGVGQTQVRVSPTVSTTYYVRVTDGICQFEGEVRVNVSDIQLLEVPDVLICFEDGGTLSVVHDGGPGCQYHWALGDGSEYEGVEPYVTPTASTTYSVTVTNSYGCTATASGKITKRVGTFPVPLEAWCEYCNIKQLDTTLIYSTEYGPDYLYQWTPEDWLANPNASQTAVWPMHAITYTIMVTDTFNCSKTATVYIDVTELSCNDTFVYIPNSFSPNADGHNDVLFVRSAILEEFYFVVYNQWGQKVFETRDLQTGWDGTFKGRQCPNGVYDYYFQGTCLDAETYEKKGNVMLVR